MLILGLRKLEIAADCCKDTEAECVHEVITDDELWRRKILWGTETTLGGNKSKC